MKKKIAALIITLALVLSTSSFAHARHRDGLEGLLIGAGSGAVIGQVIGRDAEGMIVGSVIGGTLGLMLGMDREPAVVYGSPRHARQVRAVYENRWDRHHRWDNRGPHRHERRWRQERRHYRR
ncbi:MAG: glycine zipper family protein [Proteobacteria bacterium]|nr:glycine zipper family protein [Pseudomonadota bacterium]MBU1736807.1 glycine zipper family protein [Pseudomonadota bacterium]